MASDKERAHTGISPTIASARNTFGYKEVDNFIIAQLEDLNDFCGVSNKMDEKQIIQLAWSIQVKYHYFKTAELLLFFFNLKMGMYGEMYGAVDPIKITAALVEFDKERKDAISKIEAEKRNKERLKPRKGAIPKEAYEKLKEQAKTDIESFKKLFKSFPNGEASKYWKAWLENPVKIEKHLVEFNLKKK